jgi:ribosomal protein RSM22 (predicted rRNA methylase)
LTQICVALPAELSGALSQYLEGRSRKALTERAQRLSKSFRARRPTSETIRDADDALAYALSRLPATYAATASVLGRIREEIPAFRPQTTLDLGCGLGAAAFAALETWPELESITMLDRSHEFLSLVREISQASSRPALKNARVLAADMKAPPEDGGRFDLVVLSYSATELADADLPRAMEAAWRRCAGALVVVEPGAPRDFTRLMTVRASLAQAGAFIALPCPHARPCPLEAPDWCHFSIRLARSRDHKLLKNADVPFEDEKFSYLVATREAPKLTPTIARILRPPRVLKHCLEMKLCTPAGIRETTTLRRDKARYEGVRKSSWGDRISASLED